MEITSSFPGGNIIVDAIEENLVRLRPDQRDTQGEWFYWYFEVSGINDGTVCFQFSGGRALAALGPAVSLDEGLSWRWLGAESVEGNSFRYTFGPEGKPVRFAMTVPYTEANWRGFLQTFGESDLMEQGTLTQSRQGRAVELLRLGRAGKTAVVVTARHHSCETMGSFLLEGFVSFVLSDDPAAVRLREENEFWIVPFVDKDGVEAGDQGKNRRPHDHNRDYGDLLYPETAALLRQVPEWVGDRPFTVLDLHCPWIAGGLNEKIYLVGSARPEIWEQQQRLGELLEKLRRGPLPVLAADNLPFGQDWNTADNFRQLSFAHWAGGLPKALVSTSVEIPYALASGVEVNAVSARAFGADLGRALAAYLEA